MIGEKFYGVPVLVQLKIPLAVVTVLEKVALPYANDPATAQWIPSELRDKDTSPEVTELVKYAVLRPAGSLHYEMFWVVPTPTGVATVSTLIAVSDVAAITRVHFSPPEPSTIAVPEEKRIILG